MVIYPADYPPFEQQEPGHVFLPLRQTISFLLLWNCKLKLSMIYQQSVFKTLKNVERQRYRQLRSLTKVTIT